MAVGNVLLIGDEEVDALATLCVTGFDLALKNDPNMLACLACTASSFTFSSSFFFSSASRALEVSSAHSLDVRAYAFLSAFSAFLASSSSFLSLAASS